MLFAKSLVQDTPCVVLDEPSSNLDIRHQDRIFSMAQELAREGRAVIASVHNLDVAAQYCSRLLLLESGKGGRGRGAAAMCYAASPGQGLRRSDARFAQRRHGSSRQWQLFHPAPRGAGRAST